MFNDSMVYTKLLSEVLKQEAYMLFYGRIGEQE